MKADEAQCMAMRTLAQKYVSKDNGLHPFRYFKSSTILHGRTDPSLHTAAST